DEPDVPRPSLPARDDQPRRPRQTRPGAQGPEGTPRLGRQPHPPRRPRPLRRSPRQGLARPPAPHHPHRPPRHGPLPQDRPHRPPGTEARHRPPPRPDVLIPAPPGEIPSVAAYQPHPARFRPRWLLLAILAMVLIFSAAHFLEPLFNY